MRIFRQFFFHNSSHGFFLMLFQLIFFSNTGHGLSVKCSKKTFRQMYEFHHKWIMLDSSKPNVDFPSNFEKELENPSRSQLKSGSARSPWLHLLTACPEIDLDSRNHMPFIGNNTRHLESTLVIRVQTRMAEFPRCLIHRKPKVAKQPSQ